MVCAHARVTVPACMDQLGNSNKKYNYNFCINSLAWSVDVQLNCTMYFVETSTCFRIRIRVDEHDQSTGWVGSQQCLC